MDVCNRNDIAGVMGNFNAKMGGENEGYKSCIGIHAMGDKNDKGERPFDFSVTIGLVIKGTLFHHKDIHQANMVKLGNYANMKTFKPRFNMDRLKDRGTKRMYCEAVRWRLQDNRVEEREQVKDLWEAEKTAYME